MDQKILIVEDEQALIHILSERLAKEGYTVIAATNGEDGLRRATTERPDLILLDIIMPKMDGITMLRKLREDEWGKTAQVVILTNLSDSEALQKALEEGTHEYLVKVDWKLDEVVDLVEKKLGKDKKK